MSEYTSSSGHSQHSSQISDADKIDIVSFLEDILHVLKRMWWIIVVLAAGFAALWYYRTSVSYSPTYTAQATVSVNAAGSAAKYDNSSSTAEQLGTVFPYILTSGVLQDIVAEDLGLDYMPGSVSVTNIEGTNLLTITVSGSDGQQAYDVLQSVIENYPEVAQYVVGQTELTVIDDSGVPEDTGVETVLRGSVKRGAFIGAVLGFLIVLLYMVTFRTVRSETDLRSMVSVPYLGSLPVYKKKLRKKSKGHGEINILENNPQESYMEGIRLIRTRVERRMDERHAKTLMVTSSIPGEGKSTVAANLAIAMAKKGKRVVLVDCDLRNPSTQEVFGVTGSFPGLEAVLRGKASIKSSLYQVSDGDRKLELYCLFGKSKPSQNVEILGNASMGQLIETLEGFADIVILDTPPSAMLVDASLLVKYVKNALYVVMSDFARRQYIQKGLEELDEIGIDILGCILNGGREKK